MRVLTIGDPHFKKDNEECTDILLKETLRVIEEERPDYVVVLGDIMHDHSRTTINMFNRAIEYLFKIAESMPAGKTKVLIGNHDRTNNSVGEGDDHFFKNFKDRLGGPDFVDRVRVEDDMIFAPYVPPGQLIQLFEEYGVDPNECIGAFLHQELEGCKVGIERSKVGDEWDPYWCAAISGHIHDYENYNGNIYYVGTPYQISFGDRNRKTISLYDLSMGEEGPITREKRIDLDIPSKVRVALNCDEFKDWSYDGTSLVRLTITDTVKNISVMKNTSHWKNLSLQQRIKFKYIYDAVKESVLGPVEEFKTTMSFMERLNERLENEGDDVKTIIKELIV